MLANKIHKRNESQRSIQRLSSPHLVLHLRRRYAVHVQNFDGNVQARLDVLGELHLRAQMRFARSTNADSFVARQGRRRGARCWAARGIQKSARYSKKRGIQKSARYSKKRAVFKKARGIQTRLAEGTDAESLLQAV